MIDLHCHILPGVDDGAATMEDSVAMARASMNDGVRTVLATPHGAEWAYTGDEAETRRRVADLRSELDRHGLGLEVLPGLEVYLAPDTPDLLSQGRLFTLNGSRYLLVEFPLQVLPTYAEQVLFELQLRQLVPIIAHPERNVAIAMDPDILRRMAERGMLAQVTAGSLVGAFGARTRAVAELMVQRRMVHLIASDAHSIDGRSPSLSAAVQRAAELIGREAARDMVTTLPAAILRNESVTVPDPEQPRRRSWFPFRRRES